MGHIDDPLDQIAAQYPDTEQVGLTAGLNVGGLIGSLLDPTVGALTTLTAFIYAFGAQQQKEARASAYQQGLCEGLKRLEVRLDEVERKAVGLDAIDAVVTSVRYALGSARLDKARRFGQIIGGTLADDSPNWKEAADFIRNLEQFTDADIEALKLLWNVQRTEYKVMERERRRMSTDANDYTSKWDAVLELSRRAGISDDDWYAQCARLSGFGLALMVQPNPSHQGPDKVCYRLTGRAVRLLKLLGRNGDPGAYPSIRYHETLGAKRVENQDEDEALGPGWSDRPLVT